MIEADAAQLAERIKADFPSARVPDDPPWLRTAAAKVIDCVLSLRKPYTTVVVPRVQRFVSERPDITSCTDLRAAIDAVESPQMFLADALSMRSPGKAAMLSGVVDYLLDIQSRFDEPTEERRLRAWALWVRPGDYLTLDVLGFKLAGFQYLRILFGADTVKPDMHILRYVESVLGRPIIGRADREVRAVYALERAGELLGRSVRSIDVALWERGSGQSLPS